MKKYLACLFAVVMMMVGCGGNGEGEPSFDDVVENGDAFQSECKTHEQCYEFGHTFCSAGVCIGEPQPECLPGEDCESDVIESDSEDALTEVEDDVSEDVAVPECTKNTECPLGSSCNNGQCMQNASPECTEDEDCGVGVACKCKQGSWQMCTMHACENYFCFETIVAEECEFGCEDGQCLPESAECEADADCAELDSITCDDSVWLRTVSGTCDEGQCLENSASFFVCEFGCADNACLPDPKAVLCNSDVDCTASDWLACVSFETMSEHQLTGKCLAGICEEDVYFYQCNLPCVDGCYECWQGSGCDDGNACTTDWCVEHECVYENACACEDTSDCDDNNACTMDACMNGVCANQTVANCVKCTETGECGGVAIGCYNDTFAGINNYCATLGFCMVSLVECEFGCNANTGCKSACESNAECADADDCTNDSCVAGKCVHDNQCYMFGDEDFPFYMKKCGTDADCVGTEFGDYCVDEGEDQQWCQPCYNSLKGDADIKCVGEGQKCMWGFVGNDDWWASVYTCIVPACTPEECDDKNPCTFDSCDPYFGCDNSKSEICVQCAADADCPTTVWCDTGNGGVDMYTGKCLLDGKCELKWSYDADMVKKNDCAMPIFCDSNADCPVGGECMIELCYFKEGNIPECTKDADCNFGQYCSDKFLCGMTGDFQCKFECPAGKKFAWIMSAQKPDGPVDSVTGIFKVSPNTLCMWGLSNPTFKFNCWDGAGDWSEGEKAVVTCNDENFTVKPDEKYGTQGVQVVSFTDIGCGF